MCVRKPKFLKAANLAHALEALGAKLPQHAIAIANPIVEIRTNAVILVTTFGPTLLGSKPAAFLKFARLQPTLLALLPLLWCASCLGFCLHLSTSLHFGPGSSTPGWRLHTCPEQGFQEQCPCPQLVRCHRRMLTSFKKSSGTSAEILPGRGCPEFLEPRRTNVRAPSQILVVDNGIKRKDKRSCLIELNFFAQAVLLPCRLLGPELFCFQICSATSLA